MVRLDTYRDSGHGAPALEVHMIRDFFSEEKEVLTMNEKDLQNKKIEERKKRIIEILVEIDRIHKENDGRLTIDELKLRVIVEINLDFWSLSNKLKALQAFLSRLRSKVFSP